MRFLSVLLLMLAGLTGCSEENTVSRRQPAGFASRVVVTIRGAGATFPYLVYSQLAMHYYEKTGLRLEYEKVGSQEGIAAIKAQKVDFGAADIPLSARDLESNKLVQFPMVIGGVVPVFNLPGINSGKLRLTADILADVFSGKIKRWDDPVLVAVNPGLKLPAHDIIPIYCPEGSGTAWMFQRFLELATPRWRETESTRTRLAGVAASTSIQMSNFVRRFKHTLGYVEYSHALEENLTWALLRNREGQFSSPGREAFLAAAEQATWSEEELRLTLAYPRGKASWPITGASYILLRRDQPNPAKARHMLRFFHWALTSGAEAARGMQQVTVPVKYIPDIERAWATRLQAGERVVWEAPIAAEPARAP